MRTRRTTVSMLILVAAVLTQPLRAAAQDPGPQVRPFISVDAPVVAFLHATLIDGTGAPARANHTVLIRDGMIEAVGPDGSFDVPAGAEVLDLTGKTLLPGLVMMHEHLFYPAGGAAMYNELGYSFPRLYLAGGVTVARTGGSIMPYADLNLKRMIDRGEIPGPEFDVTAPYLNGPGLPLPIIKALTGPDDARNMVRYWAGEGSTSFKAYMQISRAELGAAIEEAHARGLKVTGHLCSVTYREAADLGIDNLEHGFLASSDFDSGKQPDQCPPDARGSLSDVDPQGPEFQELINHLIERGVAITSTMTIFEPSVPGRPRASDGALDAMSDEARDFYLRRFAVEAVRKNSPWVDLFPRAMAMEKAFADAGGLLVVGTDPTGYGGAVAGFANQRAIELLVEGGFTPEEAIEIATLNGAKYLERDDEIGSVEVGKRADLIVVDGDVSSLPESIRRMELVFKAGVGFDSRKLFDAVKGTVGIR